MSQLTVLLPQRVNQLYPDVHSPWSWMLPELWPPPPTLLVTLERQASTLPFLKAFWPWLATWQSDLSRKIRMCHTIAPPLADNPFGPVNHLAKRPPLVRLFLLKSC